MLIPPTEEECVGTPSHNTGWRVCGKVVKVFCRQYRRVGILAKQLQYYVKYCDFTVNAVPTSQPEVLGVQWDLTPLCRLEGVLLYGERVVSTFKACLCVKTVQKQ